MRAAPKPRPCGAGAWQQRNECWTRNRPGEDASSIWPTTPNLVERRRRIHHLSSCRSKSLPEAVAAPRDDDRKGISDMMTNAPSPLATRQLGRAALKVTELGLGTAPLGENWDIIEEEEAAGLIAAAWDGGVRYFDTSPWYGKGQA